MNLQRHPCGTGAKQYRKRAPTDTKTQSHFVSKSIKISNNIFLRILSLKNMKMKSTRCQKSTMNHGFSILCERENLGHCWFHFGKRNILRIEGPKIYEQSEKQNNNSPETCSKKDAANMNRGPTRTQTGTKTNKNKTKQKQTI